MKKELIAGEEISFDIAHGRAWYSRKFFSKMNPADIKTSAPLFKERLTLAQEIAGIAKDIKFSRNLADSLAIRAAYRIKDFMETHSDLSIAEAAERVLRREQMLL